MTTRRTFLQTTGLALLGLAGGASDLFGQRDPVREINHTVRKGESLTVIAQKHGVSVEAIKVRNKLRTDSIQAGQRLIIPTVAAPAPASLAGVIAATRGLNIRRGRWRHIVAHHSGIEDGSAKSYDGAHRRRGMENGLAYHFVIGNGNGEPDGVLLTGPRWTAQEAGAHVADRAAGSTPNAAWFKQHSIGICLVGNGERREFTDAQLKTLARVVEDLQAACGIPDSAVFLHSDLAPVASPGRWFPRAQLALELSN